MNYATWKVQCRMALVKESLWSIVSGTETEPVGQVAKFRSRMDRALATIVLAIEPSLLYLLEDPQDPTVVLEGHYQKKTLANILALRRRLYSLKLGEGESMQDHIKRITEIFGDLSIVGDEISNEDRVVHLLASLPESYNVLATALEWNATVPKMEVLIERLLHEEKKQKERSVLTTKLLHTRLEIESSSRKLGHMRRNCQERAKAQTKKHGQFTKKKHKKH